MHLRKLLFIFLIIVLLLIAFLVFRFKGALPAVLPPQERPKAMVVDNELGLKLPEGFNIEIFAENLKSPRVLTFDSLGTLLVSVPSEGKVVAFLDFGDCHKDYLVWDTAVAITQLFITKSFGIDWMGLRNFLEGYKSIIKLNNSEINAIVPFLMLRNIKIAMQVNYMRMEKKGDKEKLLSIQQSVLKKIRLIGKNREKIYRLITGTLL